MKVFWNLTELSIIREASFIIWLTRIPLDEEVFLEFW
jgi:hypothetical protein